MANNEEKRRSSVDPGIPFRQPGLDPTRSGFDEGSRQAAGGMYAFGQDEGGGISAGDAVMVFIDIPAAELEVVDIVCVKLSCVG